MGACGAFFSLRVLQSVCVRVGDVFLVATLNKCICDIYQVPHASTRGLLL